MSICSNPMSVCGKNPTAFEGTGKRKNRVGKRIKQFYLLFDLSQPMGGLLYINQKMAC